MIYTRTAFEEIRRYHDTDDIIVLHGARQVGKTSIMRYILAELQSAGRAVHYIDLEDSRMLKLLNGGVEEFLRHLKEEGLIAGEQVPGKLFVFIDEIQYLDNPSSFLKLIADHHPGIKLIVSGSSSFAIKSKFQDSLVGRSVNFEIFPLSFREFLTFKEIPFVRESLPFTGKKNEELKVLFREYVLFGGYPRIVLTPDLARKEKYLQQIIDTYVRKDIRDLANVKDPEKFNKLLEALASQSGQMLNVTELANTTRLAKQTIEHYLFIMENTYIIRLLRPFSRNIRSELFKLPKLFFYDTGIMQMLWLKRLQQEIIGQVFESAIFGELAKSHPRDELFYWRNKDKKEIDFILNRQNIPLPIEVKLNFGQFTPTAVNYFNSRYQQNEYRLIGLEGVKRDERSIYPWEI